MQCSHPPCTCDVTYQGDFCSETCRNVSADEQGLCPCEHSTCQANRGIYEPGETVGDTPLGEGLIPKDTPPLT